MKRTATILVLLLLTVSSTGLVPANAAEDPPDVIGHFERLGFRSDLTESDLEVDGEGFILRAPSFASKLVVDKAYLEERLPGWASDRSFELSGDKLVFGGRDVRFEPFVPGEIASFTMGSDDSIRFAERPMWVSVTPHGDGLKLEMDDGDTTGQDVIINKKWLLDHGIHRPVATHESGSSITVRTTPDHRSFLLAIPHFSFTILTPADIDVQGRQEGVIAPHLGEVRWDAATKQLEIDVGLKLSPYEVLVEQVWINLHVPDVALLDHPWVIENVSGIHYYVVKLQPSQTPATLVWKPFAPSVGGAFTRGSLESVMVSYPMFLGVTLPSPAGINVTLDYESLPNHPLQAFVNASWLTALGVDRPLIGSSNGTVSVWSVSDFKTLQYTIPAQATWTSIGQGSPQSDPTMGLLGEIARELDLGDKCREAIGDHAHIATFPSYYGYGTAALYTASVNFCFEWKVNYPQAQRYSYTFAFSDGEQGIKCSDGSYTHSDGSHAEGIAICKWPDGSEFPTGAVDYGFHATAWWDEDNHEPSAASGVACKGGALVAGGALLLGFAPAFAVVGAFAAANCVEYAIDLAIDHYAGESHYYREVIWGEGSSSSIIGVNHVDIFDPGMKRGDTFNFVEHSVPTRPASWTGTQRIDWTLEDVHDGLISYHTDMSITREVEYWDADPYISLTNNQGGFTGFARTTNHGTVSAHIRYFDQVSPALDWEAPEPQCVLLEKIVGIVDGAWQYLELGGTVQTDICGVVGGIVTGQSQDPHEPWARFGLLSHNLAAEAIIAVEGNVTGAEIQAASGNLTLAIAQKLVGDQAFLDGIHHVEVAPPANAQNTQCELHEQAYLSPFSATVTGTSIAGDLAVGNTDAQEVLICFNPLVGILVEVAGQ